MEISLSTHLFVYHDIDDYIASLFPRFGFPCAEVWAMPPHFPYLDPAAADRVAGVLARRGVRTASLHAPLYPDVRTCRKDRWYSLCSSDEEHRRESVAAAAAAGGWLARNGGGTLVLHTSFAASDWYPRRWGAFLSSMNELLDRVPESTRLAVENTPLPSGRTDVILDIVARYPPGRVGVCLDLGHAHIQENVVSAIRETSDRLIHVHASDNRAERDDHLVPGRGSIPWGAVFAALRESGFPGPLTVELRDSVGGDAPLYPSFEDLLADCRKALDRYLDKRRQPHG